jgi:phosphoesterase RecJ-like protein
MWSAALEDLHLEDRILWSQVTQSMRERVGYSDNGDAGLVSFLNTVDEADIAVVFDELPDGQVNVSIRAVAGYDISGVALSLGGGGHPQAAGCTLNGPLEEARAQVLSRLSQARDEQTASR